jgi:hypothetical protein
MPSLIPVSRESADKLVGASGEATSAEKIECSCATRAEMRGRGWQILVQQSGWKERIQRDKRKTNRVYETLEHLKRSFQLNSGLACQLNNFLSMAGKGGGIGNQSLQLGDEEEGIRSLLHCCVAHPERSGKRD